MRHIRVDGIDLAAERGLGVTRAAALDRCIDPGGQLDVRRLLHGAVYIAGKTVETRGDAVCAALGIVRRLVYKVIELVKLLLDLAQGALRELHLDIRLDLTGNAAHVLAAADAALVGAASNLTAASSHDAADVIADVLVTDRRRVGAVADRARGIACDAAGIRCDVRRVHPRQARQIQRKVQIDAAEVDARICAFDVDVHIISAGGDQALIGACHTAAAVFTEQRAARAAEPDDARGRVEAGNAAHVARAGDRAREGAARDRAVILTHDAADRAGIPLGIDTALDVEIADGRALLKDAEQAGRGGAVGDRKAADRVARSEENAAERCRRNKVLALKRNVAVQNKAFPLRPCIKRTRGGKIGKVLGACNVDLLHSRALGVFRRIGGRLPCRIRTLGAVRFVGEHPCGNRRRQQQHGAQQTCKQAIPCVILHRCSPPPQSLRSGSRPRRPPPLRGARRVCCR